MFGCAAIFVVPVDSFGMTSLSRGLPWILPSQLPSPGLGAVPRRFWHREQPTTKILAAAGRDFDDWAEDEEEDGPPVPADVRYNPRNMQRQNRNYAAIRGAGGAETVLDVYTRDPATDVFWFVGKAARVSGVSASQCVARQWNLITTHSANLRPLDLFPARHSLEVWTAPGDSELDVAYHRPDAVFVKHAPDVEGAAAVKISHVGFQGEVYERGEEGFRTQRLEDGRPARPEILGPEGVPIEEEATRAPTDAEMERLRKALEGRDINELYEEQQQRETGRQ